MGDHEMRLHVAEPWVEFCEVCHVLVLLGQYEAFDVGGAFALYFGGVLAEAFFPLGVAFEEDVADLDLA